MPNEIPLPEDLNHLIEKRSGTDRRKQERRHNAAQEQAGQTLEQDRRSLSDRRQQDRRADDALYQVGSRPGMAGEYRCESCLTVVRLAEAGSRLPACPRCGVHSSCHYKRLGGGTP